MPICRIEINGSPNCLEVTLIKDVNLCCKVSLKRKISKKSLVLE
jgi:hypothetical protein